MSSISSNILLLATLLGYGCTSDKTENTQNSANQQPTTKKAQTTTAKPKQPDNTVVIRQAPSSVTLVYDCKRASNCGSSTKWQIETVPLLLSNQRCSFFASNSFGRNIEEFIQCTGSPTDNLLRQNHVRLDQQIQPTPLDTEQPLEQTTEQSIDSNIPASVTLVYNCYSTSQCENSTRWQIVTVPTLLLDQSCSFFAVGRENGQERYMQCSGQPSEHLLEQVDQYSKTRWGDPKTNNKLRL